MKFKSGKTSAEIDAAIASLGGDSVRDLPQIRTRVIAVPASERASAYAGKYAKHSLVAQAAPAVRVKAAGAPNDALYAQQWALPKISWDTAYTNVPVVGTASIAILDTGIDAAHPDLAGRVILETSFVGSNPAVDPNGHGTALAGIAAAKVDNTIGIAGVAYNDARVLSVQVLHADGTGLDSDVVAGVLWAADNGADVILMGFSSPDFSAALQDAVNYAWSKGAVLVAATGNGGSAGPTYPAGMANVIGVAATDQNDAIAAASNTASAAVAAPGVDISATQPGGGYGTITGTSAAAAETAGLAALLIASGKTNGEASTQIRGATDALAGQIFGRINVNKALTTVAIVPTPSPSPTPTPGPTPSYRPATNCQSASTGNWNSSSTWTSCGGGFPASGDNVTIQSPNIVSLTADQSASSVTINSGGTLSLGSSKLTLTGNGVAFTNNGTYSPGSGTVDYNNTKAQTIGAGTYFNLTISGSRGNNSVTLASGTISVAGTLALTATFGSGTYVTTGNTFNFNGSGSQSVPALTPGSYNNVTVSGGGTKTLVASTTLSGDLTVAGVTLDAVANLLQRSPFGGTITLTSGATLKLAGVSATPNNTFSTFTTRSLDPASTVQYSGAGNQTVATIGSPGYGSLALSGTGTKTMPATAQTIRGNLSLTTGGALTADAGAGLVISGDVSISAGATFNAASFTHSVAGNWTNSGTFTSATSTIVVNGTSAQTIGGTPTSFNGLAINNSSGGVTLTSGATVGGTLTLTNGVLTTGTNTLIANGSVTRTNGFVSGFLRKPVASGSSSLSFEIGSGSTYAPIGLAIVGASPAGNLTASATSGQHPSFSTSGISNSRYVNRYWTLVSGGSLSVTSYDATFTFANPGDLVGSPNTGALIVRKFSSGSWTAPPSGSTSTSTTATGSSFTSFSDFAVGEAAMSATTTTAANATAMYGDTSVTLNATVTSTSTVNQGTVTFTIKSGSTTIGTPTTSATLTIGTASVAYALPAGTSAGSYTIVASYSGGTSFSASSDSTHDFTINRAHLLVNAGANSKTYGDIDPAFAWTLSGFVNGQNATTALVTGAASCSRTAGESVAGSPYTITCAPGTLAAPNYDFATGTTASFTINRANTTTGVTSSVNPSVNGQSVTFTATVTAVAPGAGTPTSTVQFKIDGTASGLPVALSGGSASISTSSLAVGSHSVSADYTGDGNFNGSTSAAITQAVAKSATLTYTGDYFVFNTATPALGVLVDQRTGTGPTVDYTVSPVWARFDLNNSVGSTIQTRWAPVTNAPSWSSTGLGVAKTTANPLPAGSYTVVVNLVRTGTSAVSDRSPSVIAPAVQATLVSSAVPLSGSSVTGSGSINPDSSANTTTKTGAFNMSVSYSATTGLSGSTTYKYLVNMDVGGGNFRNVWITTTSSGLSYLGVTMTSASTGTAVVTGTATVKYTDQATGTAYTQFDLSAAFFELTVTDAGTTGDQYAIAIRNPDGTFFHASTLPYNAANGSATKAPIVSGSITVRG